MTWRRRSAVLALVGLAALLVGAGAFSSAAVDRPVTVATADDDRAFLGVAQNLMDPANGTLRVRVTNRFPTAAGPLDVTVAVDGTTATLGPLGPGEAGTHTFDGVQCGVPFSVHATGPAVDVTFDRPVACG